MSGAATLLFMLSCCQGFALDDIEPPQDLNIAVPALGRVVLTWKHIVAPPNTTVKYLVKIRAPGGKTIDIKKSTNFTSHYLALHRGVTAQVAAEIQDPSNVYIPGGRGRSEWVYKDLPPPAGVDGTSVTDLSCHIDIEACGRCSLVCSWTPGDKAPADTEYNLYCGYNGNIDRCENYTTEPGGLRRCGGHFPQINISANSVTWITVHINGTSRSLNIKTMEQIFISTKIEKIPPVQNLKTDVTGLHWTKPVTTLPDACFTYQVTVSSKSRNITASLLSFSDLEQHSAVRQLIGVRAVGKFPCWSALIYSPWTEMILPGEGTDRSDATGIIVSVCVIAAFIITFILCIRCWRHLFPEIPKPRNDLKEAFQNLHDQALMRCNSWDNEEVISYIEEIGPSEKYMTSTDYGHIADYSSSRFCRAL